MFKAIFFLLFCVVSFSSFSQSCVEFTFSESKTGWFPNASAACSALNGVVVSVDSSFRRVFNSMALDSYGNCAGNIEVTSMANGSVSTMATGLGVTTRSTAGACPVPTPTGGNCAADKGKVSVVNVTVGYTRTGKPGDTSYVGGSTGAIGGSEGCNAGCSVQFGSGADAVTAFYTSQTPTPQGLYRDSADYAATGNGTACSTAAKNAATDPLTPSPACPGYVGEVNGVKGCYGTADKPVITTPGPRPPVEPTPGNPSAGIKPSAGEGSGIGGAGRTPTGGTGENDGGPASAVGAGAPSGTASAPAAGEVQKACGAPGQPKCRIDESGTPDGKNALTDADTKLGENETKVKLGIDAAGNIPNPAWTFSFQFPQGCSPYSTGIKGVILDVCRWQSTIHDLMSMIWAAVTVFSIIGMVGRTVREA